MTESAEYFSQVGSVAIVCRLRRGSQEHLLRIYRQTVRRNRSQQERKRCGASFRWQRIQQGISCGEAHEGRQDFPDLRRNGSDPKTNHRTRAHDQIHVNLTFPIAITPFYVLLI